MNKLISGRILSALLAVASIPAVADSIPVTNTNGDATTPGSLGAALTTAASDTADSDTITFSSLFNSQQVIDPFGPFTAVSKSSGESLNLTAPSQLTINVPGTSGFSFTGGGDFYLGNITITGGGGPSNPALSVSGGSTVFLNDASVSGNIGLNTGSLDTVTGFTTTANVSLTGTNSIAVAAGQTSTFSGIFSGAGALVSNGSGTLVLSNYANAYTGGTVIGNGTVMMPTTQTNVSTFGAGPIAIDGAGILALSGTGSLGQTGMLTAGGGTLNIASSLGASFTALSRPAGGGLTIIPNTGTTLGSFNQFVRFTTAPTVTNGIVDASIVATNSATDTSADFLTYSGPSSGLARATYSTATQITNGGVNGTTSASVFEATSTTNNIVTGSTTLYALKVDSGATVTGGPLTLGDGIHTAGLILNGGTSLSPTTITSGLTFANGSEGVVYVGGAGTSDYAKIGGVLAGNNGLTKNGNGSLELTSTVYTGTTTVNGGTLQFDANNINTPGAAANSVINLASALVYSGATVNGTINLTADATLASVNNNVLNLQGTINGNGHALTLGTNPILLPSGTVSLGGMINNVAAFNVAYGTVLIGGTLENATVPINVISQLEVGGNATVANPLNFQNGFVETSGAATFSGPITLSGSGDNQIAASSGSVATLGGALSGSGPLIVEGVGNVSITGFSPSYTGTISSSLSFMDVSGSLPNATIEGGHVSGTGTVGLLSLRSGGKIHPGEIGSIGTLTASSLQWVSDGTPQLQFQLSNTSNASSLLDLGSGAFTDEGGNSTFAFDFLSTGAAGQQYDLINFGAGNTNFNLSDFAATDLAPGLSATFDFVTNGDTESLMVDVVPEPQTNAMLLAGLVGLAAFAGYRSRKTQDFGS